MALQTATNPQTGERVALVNDEWVPITQTATNPQTGERVGLINNEWMPIPGVAPKPTAKPAPKVAASNDFDFSNPMGTGAEEMMAVAQPKSIGSVLEKFPGAPPQVDAELNRQAMLKSGSPESVMFTAGRAKQQTDQDIAAYQAKQKADQAKAQQERERLRQGAKTENYGFTDFLKDSGVDLAKGVVGLNEAYVGLLDLTSGGAAGRVLSDYGYNPAKASKFLNGFQSLTRKNAAQDVQDAEGFVNTLKSLVVNPTELIGNIVESLPGTVAAGGAGGVFARFLAERAALEAAALNLSGDAATKFIADKVKSKAAQIAGVASGAEGAQTAGSTAEAGRQAGTDFNDYVLPALAAGLGTTAIGVVSGKAANKLGIGDIETHMAAKTAGVKGVGVSEGSAVSNVLKEMAKEGLLEELPQSTQEQIFQNLATGRPWDEGVDQAAAQGLMAGAAMAGGHATWTSTLQAASSKLKGGAQPTPAAPTVQQTPTPPEAPTAPVAPTPPAPPTALSEVKVDEAAAARRDRINAATEQIEQMGIPADNARAIATRQVDAALTSEAKTAAIKIPEGRVEEITQDLISAGVAPQQAAIDARNLAQAEAEADAKAAEEGAQDVTRPNAKRDRTSVPVAEPAAPIASTTGEPTGAERNGVVPAEQNVGEPVAREVAEPTAITENWKSLGQVQRYEEPGVGRATTDKPHGIYTTPADVESPHKDLGGERSTWNVNKDANVLDVTPFAGPDVAMRQSAVGAGAGVAAAKHILGPDIFNRLKQLSKEDLIYEAKAMLPSVDFSKYYDAQEVMEALGAQLAKQAGYDAIWQADKDPSYSEFVALTDNAMTPTKTKPAETEGVNLGTETPEAQQAETQGQEAPAAGAVAPAKRGRPAVKQTHVVVANTEGGFDHVANGEVVESYKNKKQATAAVDLAKAKDKGSPELIAKNQAKLDAALASQGRGRPAGVKVEGAPTEKVEKVSKEIKEELDALESALDTYNSPDSDTEQIKIAAGYIHDIARDTTVPKEVRVRAQQMMEEQVDEKDLPRNKRALPAKFANSPASAGFKNATNGAQAANHVIKTGTLFQRFVAQRLRNFVTNVRFVVLERGDTIPPEMYGARGLFVYDSDTKERVIYVRGASFGDMQGINNVTVLHELLHAATASRIEAGLLGGTKNAQLQKFMAEMQALMQKVEAAYHSGVRRGTVSSQLQDLVETDVDFDPKTGKPRFEVFTSPHEFLAYGMSSDEFQHFLMGIEGERKAETGFTKFVTTIRDLFGIKAGEATAFSDLVNITDDVLNATGTAPEQRQALQQKKKFKPPVFDEKEDLRARRSAKKLARDTQVAKAKVAASREGNIGEATAEMQAARDPVAVREVIASKWDDLSYAAREQIVKLPTFDVLAKLAADKGIPTLMQVNTQLEHMLGMSQKFLGGASQVIDTLKRGFKEDPNLDRTKFENFVYATTLAEIDPSDPNAVERSKELDKDYKALGAVGQRMYKQLKSYYESIIELYSDLLDAQINNIQGMSPEEKSNLMLVLRKTFEAKARITPFFPLVRRGDFWLAIGEGAQRQFYLFETRADRNAKAKELAARQGDSLEDLLFQQKFTQGNDLGSLRAASKDSSAMLKQVFEAIDKMEIGAEGTNAAAAKEGLKDAVYQVYLTTMPEQSFRRQFTHRKGRTGFSTDLQRNIATTASKQAIQLSRLKYAPMLRNSLSQARDSIREREELSPFVQEAEKRINLALSGQSGGLGEAVAGVANKASYFWYLSGVSSALIQPASVFISGLPVLAANHNNAVGAGLELAKMATLVNQYSVVRKNIDGTTSIVAPSLANNKSLPTDERKAVSEMVSRGVTQSTYASLVWGYKSMSTEQFEGIRGKGKQLANLMVGALMHNTERLSREAVYLASYRLGRSRGLSYEEAVQQAANDTNEALGNYDITNRPRFMQQGLGKVAFQFKMYPLQMTLLMLTNFKKMLPFLNKDGKKAAATKFFGMMGTSALAGGVANMALFSPIMGLLGWAWGAMGKDKEWPEELKDIDFETWFKTVFLPAQLGDVSVGGVPLSDLIERGPLNALTGWEIASRIGLNDLWGRDSKETKTSRDSAIAFMLDRFGGPTASLALSFADAYDAYAMGDYQKMTEKLLPAALRNLAVVNRMANEGMKTARGMELVTKDDVKLGELVGQAIGFQPDLLSATQVNSFKLTGVEQRIVNQRSMLLNKLDFEHRKDTPEGEEKFDKIIEDEVLKFNTKYPSYALDADTIITSLEKKAEQRAGARAGVVTTEKNLPIIEGATDTMEARLDKRAAEMKARREKAQ